MISKKWFEDMESAIPHFFTNSMFPMMDNGFLHKVEEKNSYYHISLDVPGVDPKSIRLKTQGQNLSITSSEEYAKDQERNYRSVNVSFAIPSHVDVSEIEANVENGVMDVILPKTKTAQVKEIPVHSSTSTSFLDKVNKQLTKKNH